MSSPTTPFRLWLVCGALVAGSPRATAALDLNGTAIHLDFTGMAGAGFLPNPGVGQLDSDDWAITGFSDGDLNFGDTAVAGDYARGSSLGNVTTSGIYGFIVAAGDSSLGVQPGSTDFTPGTITLRVQNATGSPIQELRVDFVVQVLNNAGFATSVSFSHSADGVNFTAIPALDVVTPAVADGSPIWMGVPRQTNLGGLELQVGEPYFLRWSSDDASGSGSRDEIALDDITIVADGALFRGDFEAGDTSDWSLTVP